MINLKNAKFHTVGTNANSYIKRFNDKYSEMEYFIVEELGNEINIYAITGKRSPKLIDAFYSTSTLNQFINSLLAYGYIKEDANKFCILNPTLEDVWNSIFIKESNININIIRQSRIISLLKHINFINEENFKDINILGKRGSTKITNIQKETSKIELDLIKDFEHFTNVLERIKKYEFQN